jgi:hypothetical protein
LRVRVGDKNGGLRLVDEIKEAGGRRESSFHVQAITTHQDKTPYTNLFIMCILEKRLRHATDIWY